MIYLVDVFVLGAGPAVLLMMVTPYRGGGGAPMAPR